MTLSHKRRAFVEEYLRCWNATEAAKRAGYSMRTAHSQGPRLLAHVEVQKEIEARLAEKTMSADEVLIRLAEQARAEYAGYLNDDGTVNLPRMLADGKGHLVKGAKFLFQSLITIDIDAFDADPTLLNCANGVVDLATGALTAHDCGQRFTYCVPVNYTPGADRSLWVDFLTDVVAGGSVVLDFLQMAVGYSLTGHNREECLFYIHGPTRSGKGTFSETLLALLPKPISVEVDFNTFTATRDQDSQNFDLAPLKPARLVFASESNKYQSLNAGKIKSLTGGNDVWCAFKHRDHFSYRPQFKVWLVSNHPVNADVDDDAVWYRVKVLEFPNSLANREDKTLKLRMREPTALEGVLAWAVEGAIKWFAAPTGLVIPDAVNRSTQQHRADLDYVQSWINECCEVVPANWESSANVYQSYKDWCIENGVRPKEMKGLSSALKAKGCLVSVIQKVNSVNRRGIVGLRLLP